MRCAIDFDENKPLADQNVRAWGEMQSLEEEPEYKEEDIKGIPEKNFLHGYKCALDDVCNTLANFVEDGQLPEAVSNEMQLWFGGDLCMQLFSILDEEACEEDEEE